ncbi:hypothetical protein BDW22DRAFT_1340540, partial [Trametopsis cervina]
PVRIISDSRYALTGILHHATLWEERGWIGTAHSDLFKTILSLCRSRQAETSFRWVKGHSTSAGNKAADGLAAAGAQQHTSSAPLIAPVERFLPSGAQVAAMTQSLLYKGLRARKVTKPRQATAQMLDIVAKEVLAISGYTPSAEATWKAARDRTHNKKIQAFLWRVLHQSYPCGKWWTHIPECTDRAYCTHCGVEDTMEHILTQCTAPGQAKIWEYTAWVLGKKGVLIPKPSFGLIAGINLLSLTRPDGSKRTGASRLTRILIAEAAHLIWRLRCERVIEWENDPSRCHSTSKIARIWGKTLDQRLDTDISLTNPRIPTSRRLKPALVLRTWAGTIARESDFPENWLNYAGVLVGRPPPEPGEQE